MAAPRQSRNPFDDDNDDFEIVGKTRRRADDSTLGWGDDFEDYDGDGDEFEINPQQKQMTMREKIEQRTLQSTERSLRMVDDSERVGVATAQELLEQREQLERTDQNLDNINQDLKQTQRHLNSIKSVFGAIGNYFRKDDQRPQQQRRKESSDVMSSALDGSVPQNGEHPGLKIRSEEGASYRPPHQQQQQLKTKDSTYDEQIENNLGEMSLGMSRLKGLAMGMQDELHTQNELIDRIDRKVERAQPKIEDQNRQMKKLLR